MSTVIKQLSINELSELYQVTYGGFETDSAGWDNAQLLGSIRKNEKFNGKQLEIGQLIDYGGGQSSGSLPSSSTAYIINPTLTAKQVYSTSVLTSQAMKAARRAGNNLGAYEDATKLSMDIMKLSFQDQIARQFFGDGTGELGAIASVVTNSPGDYSLTISSASWIEAHWMINDLLNVASSTDLFLINAINTNTRVIRVIRQAGSHVPLALEKIYKQKSKDQEMFGIKGICDAVAGQQLYGVDVGYRWQPTTLDSQGGGLSIKMFRDLDQKMRFLSRGVLPTDYIFSHTQLRLFEDSEDAKSITYIDPIVAPNREAGGQVAAIKINGRTVRIQWSPYCQEDRVYAMNRNKVSLELRPDTVDKGEDCGGYIMNGDNIFFPLQVSGTPLDSYAMFYATYGNFYFNPVTTGCITNLPTS
jgi:hypothetical protein